MRQQLADEPSLCVGSRCRAYFKYAYGSSPFRLADWIKLITRGRALPLPQRASEQPVREPESDRADLVLHPAVVDRQLPIVDVARARGPSLQAVVQRTGTVRDHPCVQRIGHGPGLVLTDRHCSGKRRYRDQGLDSVDEQLTNPLGDFSAMTLAPET